MFKKYTEKDFRKIASKKVQKYNKGSWSGKFYYLNHYIKVDNDECGCYPSLVVEMKRVCGEDSKTVETVYTETYI